MDNFLTSGLAVLAAYLLGSLSFAVIVSRLAGLSDPRTYGSKNPGATNVLRSGSKPAAIATLVLDALKGYAPVMAAAMFAPRLGFGETTVALVGLAAFIGHLWPVFFRFAGGKGVATAAGVLFGFDPWLGLATLVTFGAFVLISRYVSLSSMAAAVLAPLFQLVFTGAGPVFFAVAVMGMLLVWRHAANLQRLLAGTESKLGSKSKPDVPQPVQRATKSHHRKVP